MTRSTPANTIPLVEKSSKVILIDANASALDLSNEINEKIAQAKGITHLLGGINLNDIAGIVPDDCISNIAWGLTRNLEALDSLTIRLLRLAGKTESADSGKAVGLDS